MRVLFLPHVTKYEGNPYWEQLQHHLSQLGVRLVRPADELHLQWRWLIQNRKHVDVIHLHHLRHHYQANDKQASVKLLIKFVGKLLLARLLGYHIVWTVHNLFPHERLRPHFIGTAAHAAVAQLSDAVIVHCEQARTALARAFYRRRNVHAIPHASYIGVYPNTIEQRKARKAIGLPQEKLVYVFLGTIRPYKGLEELVEAFQAIADPQTTLVLAGRPWDQALVEGLQSAAASDSRIIVRAGFIPDEELQLYLKAADVGVLPFADVLSSGSALLMMSFGLPVVAPRLGCLPETISEGMGILYDPKGVDRLREALCSCRSLDLRAMGQKAFEEASTLTWQRMAEQTVKVYEGRVRHNAAQRHQ